tara:strand:- start:1620 stop:2081 length:462 start_codon:yes stop_codon:yes gene_type:complete
MILTPNELMLFLVACKDAIAEINHIEMIIDDSQLANRISEVHVADNLLLYGVLPDYGGDYRDEEGVMYDNGLDFLILKKTEYTDVSYNEFNDLMQETLMVARKFLTYVYSEKNNPNTCPTFYYLKEGSEKITPVWAKAGCNGYMVSFNLRTEL